MSKEHSVCYLKIVSSFTEKEHLFENFILERTQGSINSGVFSKKNLK